MNRRIVLDDDAITTKKGPSVISLESPVEPVEIEPRHMVTGRRRKAPNTVEDNPFEPDDLPAYETIRVWVGESVSEECADLGHDVRPSTGPAVLMECARCGMHVEERQVHPLFGKIYGK